MSSGVSTTPSGSAAKHFGIAYGSVRNRASQESWCAELRARREQLRIAEAWEHFKQCQAYAARRAVQLEQWKQRQLERLALVEELLERISWAKLKPKEIPELLELGLTSEREALRLPIPTRKGARKPPRWTVKSLERFERRALSLLIRILGREAIAPTLVKLQELEHAPEDDEEAEPIVCAG